MHESPKHINHNSSPYENSAWRIPPPTRALQLPKPTIWNTKRKKYSFPSSHLAAALFIPVLSGPRVHGKCQISKSPFHGNRLQASLWSRCVLWSLMKSCFCSPVDQHNKTQPEFVFSLLRASWVSINDVRASCWGNQGLCNKKTKKKKKENEFRIWELFLVCSVRCCGKLFKLIHRDTQYYWLLIDYQ